jgi:hypothetical protein
VCARVGAITPVIILTKVEVIKIFPVSSDGEVSAQLLPNTSAPELFPN